MSWVWFPFGAGPFWVEFACSPCARVGFLRVPQLPPPKTCMFISSHYPWPRYWLICGVGPQVLHCGCPLPLRDKLKVLFVKFPTRQILTLWVGSLAHHQPKASVFDKLGFPVRQILTSWEWDQKMNYFYKVDLKMWRTHFTERCICDQWSIFAFTFTLTPLQQSPSALLETLRIKEMVENYLNLNFETTFPSLKQAIYDNKDVIALDYRSS